MAVLDGGAVLDQQNAMTNGRSSAGASSAASAAGRHGVGGQGIVGHLGDSIDNTPRFVAGLVLGAALTIFALRVAGFRFSFGANIGG